MSNVAELLKSREEEVATIEPGATVLKGAERMNERRIGSLVVVDGETVVGIMTERDILTRVVATGRDPAKTKVADVMTTQLITCAPETTLDELRGVMREKRIRHVPVMEGDRLSGMVSIGDLNTAEVKVMEETIGYLEQYMYRG